MLKYYDVPTQESTSIHSFLHALVNDLKTSSVLATDGIILRDNDLEMVIGTPSSLAFKDRAIIDKIALYMRFSRNFGEKDCYRRVKTRCLSKSKLARPYI